MPQGRIVTEFDVAELEEDHDYDLVVTEARHVVRESPGALLLKIHRAEHWVPRSQCRQDSKSHIWVASWWLKDRGIEV